MSLSDTINDIVSLVFTLFSIVWRKIGSCDFNNYYNYNYNYSFQFPLSYTQFLVFTYKNQDQRLGPVNAKNGVSDVRRHWHAGLLLAGIMKVGIRDL